MWQLLTLGALFFSAGENIVDKSALITDKRVDYAVATLWRISLYVFCVVAIGLTGILGTLTFSLSPWLLLFGIPSALASLGYTYLLRRVEVTGIGAITYLSPFLFLAVDALLLHTSFTSTELFGIILVTFGGFGFAIDGKTHHFKREFSLAVWALLFYDIIQTGAEAYLFKYLNATQGVSPMTFFLMVWLSAVVFLFALVLYQRKTHLLFKKAALVYLPRAGVGKLFDAVSSLLWAQALALAAVSQVSALGALDPLVLFVMTVAAQRLLGMRVGEKTARTQLQWKAISIGVLVFGGWLLG
jgi:drug/metabolite transporter (DMT)-like permease